MRLHVLTASLVLAAACTEAPGPDVGVATTDLLVADGVQLWTARGNVIPVCFLNGTAAERQQVRAAVARTWTSAAAIRFVWSDGCPFSGADPWVRVSLRRAAGALSSGSTGAGLGTASLPTDRVWCMDDYGSFVPCAGVDLVLGTDPSSADFVIVHEFGHVLGFEHEQNRAEAEARACEDNQDIIVGVADGPYDPESVMNYCGARRGFLSEGDRASVRAWYGARPDRRDQFADLDADGSAEPIATNLEGTYALASNSIPFGGFRAIFGPFYGERATLYGDVDGDGDDDGVAVNADAVYVARSNGGYLDFDGAWTSGPFYGARRTLLGDVDGDGLADLVAVNPEAAWVMRSTAAGFVWAGAWCTDCYGDVQTDLADVTGDGRADLIANRGAGGMWVARATGLGFEPLEQWSWLGLRADRDLAFGDATGDGRADALSVRDDQIVIRRSTGDGFGPLEYWTTIPFYGTRATRFADVSHDGRVDVIAINDDADYVAVSNGSAFVPYAGPWTVGPFYSIAP